MDRLQAPSWTQQERTIRDTPIGTVIFNVVTPTITPYLPDPAKAGRTGIIVAPYGAMPQIPSKLPPVFMAWAQDDAMLLNEIQKFYDALRVAGNKPEAHIFASGGHGFGTKKQGTSSDSWSTEFYDWLVAQHLVK